MRTKPKKAFKKKPAKPAVTAIGIDISPACMAGCIKVYDPTLNRLYGPGWHIKRWPKGTPEIQKLGEVAKGHDFLFELMGTIPYGIIRDFTTIHLAIENVPPKAMNAQRQAQQLQIIGAFVGGLARYGYQNIHLVTPRAWQAYISADFDMKANKDWTKWHVKNWCIEVYDAPKWKDLIYNSKLGLIPKPKGSKAMPVQPDDRYDACGIMEYAWMLAHNKK